MAVPKPYALTRITWQNYAMSDQKPAQTSSLDFASQAVESLHAAIVAAAEAADAAEVSGDFGIFVFPSETDRNEVWSVSHHEAHWPHWVPQIIARKSYRARVEEAFYQEQQHSDPLITDNDRVLADLESVFDGEAPSYLHYDRYSDDHPIADSSKRIIRLMASRREFELALSTLSSEHVAVLNKRRDLPWQASLLESVVVPLEHWPFKRDGRLGPERLRLPKSVHKFLTLTLDRSPKKPWLAVAVPPPHLFSLMPHPIVDHPLIDSLGRGVGGERVPQHVKAANRLPRRSC